MSELEVTLQSMHLHPVKSCAGIAVRESLIVETGLEFDRAWMVVDEQGEFLSQRELPKLQLVTPTLRLNDVVLRAPGMLALHLALDAVDQACRVRVWDDWVNAWDMGGLAAQWFSDYLGRKVRLARFDPEVRRLAEPKWTGELQARTAFSDGFPLLLVSTASLAELNRRLLAQGHESVAVERFRPNLVIDGLRDAHAEDFIHEIVFATPEGEVRLRLVKPCARCTIPDVDPRGGEQGHAVADTLAAYRADARFGGGLTFGMNAVIVEGIDRTLRVGLRGVASLRF